MSVSAQVPAPNTHDDLTLPIGRRSVQQLTAYLCKNFNAFLLIRNVVVKKEKKAIVIELSITESTTTLKCFIRP